MPKISSRFGPHAVTHLLSVVDPGTVRLPVAVGGGGETPGGK